MSLVLNSSLVTHLTELFYLLSTNKFYNIKHMVHLRERERKFNGAEKPKQDVIKTERPRAQKKENPRWEEEVKMRWWSEDLGEAVKMSCVWAARQGMFRRDLGIIQKYPVSPPTEGNRLIRVLALCSDCGCNLSHSCCSALLVHLTTPPFPRHCSCTNIYPSPVHHQSVFPRTLRATELFNSRCVLLEEGICHVLNIFEEKFMYHSIVRIYSENHVAELVELHAFCSFLVCELSDELSFAGVRKASFQIL